MEFLLINHPLDCPICDQAGECQLQEYSVEFGTAGSRFLDEKVKKPKRIELGPRVTLDDERCILCSRCIRFMKGVANDDVLGFVSRGSQTYLTAHPDKRLESNYSLNTVDICPVGALTSTDFRFKMRVWFLKETKSICTSCATGCNTVIGTRLNVIYRQTPRENNEVNSSWMCDYGRLNFHYLNSPERLQTPKIREEENVVDASWKSALARAGDELKKFVEDQIAVIGSARMTNEELWLTKKLIESLGTTDHDVVPRRGEADKILVSADRNPNTLGAQLFGVTNKNPGAKLPKIVEKIRSGSIRAIVALGEDLTEIGLTAERVCLGLPDATEMLGQTTPQRQHNCKQQPPRGQHVYDVLLKGVGECGTAEDVCTPILGEPKVEVDNLIGNIVRRAADRPSIRSCSRTVLPLAHSRTPGPYPLPLSPTRPTLRSLSRPVTANVALEHWQFHAALNARLTLSSRSV